MKFFTTSDISSLHSSDSISSHLQNNYVTSTPDLAHTEINKRWHHKQADQTAEQVPANNDKDLQNHSANHSKSRDIHSVTKFASELNCFSSNRKT